MDKPSRLRIVIVAEVDEDQRTRLNTIAPGCDIHFLNKGSDLTEVIADADVVAGDVTPEELARAQKLKWVHSWAAGPNTQLFPDFVRHEAVLTCSKGNGAIPLAEHAMMMMLMLNRNAMRWAKAQSEGRWDRFVHDELAGKTVGIIGTGNSGTDLATKARAFHMKVLGLRRSMAIAPGFDTIYRNRDLHTFLRECDFVVVTAPLTLETKDMLGEKEFRLMKPSAFYICFSRGGIANDDALLRALSEGWIAGAGLDAHLVEPLPIDSPFWKLPNTIITPHNGATTDATGARGFSIFERNLDSFLHGKALTNIIDKQVGY
ncbi:D-2-hydroxyacid dehydrogenase [Rhizobium leguminosarum]|uniref:D-2-hydroxyacid dehydrogenase n=1 Tax=Rhizobium leguminosarum TaxID=384 RepID=UPI001C9644E9|nr:D-2-hydroxyacid dehydrogenase [Rhizobium leguminosarum]MBY5541672.1 D-2-hydroxyacid dehydrogenase [Rhizobium leguminosarum]